MKGKVLHKDQGAVTFEVLVSEGKVEADALPKHVFVPEVVLEERMHYYKVPRLGSYLAIKLEFNSCLNEESYNTAIENYKKIKTLNQA
jgi:hypothetical protein